MDEQEKLDVAMEMLGGRLVGDFVREVWAKASEEQKKELADIVIGKVADFLKSDTFDLRDICQRAVHAVAREYLDGIVETRKKQIKAKVEQMWPDAVEKAAKSALDLALSNVSDRMRQSFRAW